MSPFHFDVHPIYDRAKVFSTPRVKLERDPWKLSISPMLDSPQSRSIWNERVDVPTNSTQMTMKGNSLPPKLANANQVPCVGQARTILPRSNSLGLRHMVWHSACPKIFLIKIRMQVRIFRKESTASSSREEQFTCGGTPLEHTSVLCNAVQSKNYFALGFV